MCRDCDTGGAPLQRWDHPAATPQGVTLAAATHRLAVHPDLVRADPDRPWYWTKWCASPDHHEWIHGELARHRKDADVACQWGSELLDVIRRMRAHPGEPLPGHLARFLDMLGNVPAAALGQAMADETDRLWRERPPLAAGCAHDFRVRPSVGARVTVACRECGGFAPGLSEDMTAGPQAFTVHPDGRFGRRVTADSYVAGLEPCSVDYPVTGEQALGWARQAQWGLRSYFKFTFTFEAYCTVAYPDDPEAHEVEAFAEVSGQPEDFYRFSAGPDPLTWDQLCYVRTPDLVISEGGRELIRIDGGDD